MLDESVVASLRLESPVYVTRPNMPSLEAYHESLKQIWQRRWLTNQGPFHEEFEARLAQYLAVENVNLFCNGTIALLVALQALRLTSGEVITTPFTFPATPHVIYWNRLRPVFCDIDPVSYCINPDEIERHIGPETKAILGVHVYGIPCAVDRIQEIADRHGLFVIYDAAHAFGVKYKGRSILDYGDLNMLSFHATKLFSTMEGGALVVRTPEQKKRIDFLKNFGIANEETVIGPGINGKMNELQAAYGLLQLDMVDEEIASRATIDRLYRERLSDLPGLTLPPAPETSTRNYAYFPILVDEETFGCSRDEVHQELARVNVYARKYFYPLCSTYACYSAYPSSRASNLPVATRVANEVLCLPLYGGLAETVARTICDVFDALRELYASGGGYRPALGGT